MRIGFKVDPNASDGWNLLELRCAKAFEKGLRRQGVACEFYYDGSILDPTAYDVVAIFGVKNQDTLFRCVDTGTKFLYFDKAYNRNKSWWKISVCGHHPTRFLPVLRKPRDRRVAEGWHYKQWRPKTDKGHILIAGSSGKYHKLYELDDPTAYWTSIIKEIRNITDRKILYRPKKSWREATPIKGSEFSKAEKIEDDLKDAHCMITHGSNSCFEALMEGIPAIVLGSGITAPISSGILTEETIANPYEADVSARDLILNNLAYFQWSMQEIELGYPWGTIDQCLSLAEKNFFGNGDN